MQLTAAIIGPAHGLRGEVILDVRSDDPGVVAPGMRLDVEGTSRVLTVRAVRVHKERRGCSSRSIRRKPPGIPTNSRDLRLAHPPATSSARSAA